MESRSLKRFRHKLLLYEFRERFDWLVSTWEYSIFRTLDGAQTWEEFSTPFPLTSIFFVDAARGWGGGSNGEIYYTSDGGQNWVAQASPLGRRVNELKFTNASMGWAEGPSGAILHTTNGGTTFVEQAPPSLPLPQELTLYQNHPNPFNPSTTITFSVPTSGHVALKIYDLLGREVLTLVDELMFSGHHQATLDARTLSSGIYFYRITARESSRTKKMLLLR